MWDPVVAWLAGGVALLVAEIVMPGVFLMWLGLAALGTGLAVWAAGLPFGGQIAVFGVLALAGIAVALRLRRNRATARLNTRDAGLVGRRAHALGFEGSEGRVRVGDSDWAARVPAGVSTPAKGDLLEVAGVDGTVLVVRPPERLAKA